MFEKLEKSKKAAAAGLAVVAVAGFTGEAVAQPDAVGRNSTPDLINNGYKQVAHEATYQAEQNNPQAFIDSFDKRLAKEVQAMHFSPYFSSIRHPQLSKALHTEITIRYVGAPSKQYPGRYDWLAVTMKKGERVPLTASINLGTDSKTYIGINGKYKSGYGFGQVNESGNIMRSMLLGIDGGPGDPGTYFEVSSEGYPAPSLPKDGVKYSSNPSKVSAAYNAFLNQIQSIETCK